MIGRGLYRLRPPLVRALIPPGHPGSYILYAVSSRALEPRYNGRSDHDVVGRLASHVRAGRCDYFSYDVYRDAARMDLVECATFRLRPSTAANLIHTAAPRGSSTTCPFCSVRGFARGHSVHPVASEPLPAAQSKED